MLFFGVQCRCSEYEVGKLYHLSKETIMKRKRKAFLKVFIKLSWFLLISGLGLILACRSWSQIRVSGLGRDTTPSSIWFCDEDARKAFSENFSRRDIHSDCQVILADFADTDLSIIIHSWGWESLCAVPVICPSVLIQEFHSNMHGFDFSVPHFITQIGRAHV